MKDYNEYIGQTINEWKILEYVGKRGKKNKTPYVKCQCSCGKVKEVSLYSITRGASKSCGHQRRMDFIANNPNPTKNETGNRFGRLLVLEQVKKENDTRAYWRCKCDCGKEIIVSGKQLRSGNTTSCGCYRAELLRQRNLEKGNVKVGNVYGYLTVIKKGELKNHYQHWICRCRCGNLVDIVTGELNRRTMPSCGCIVSKGEAIIVSLLQEHNINFKRQYSFNDLYINTDKARFDFAILDDNDCLLKLIEYNGYQHYDENDKWYNGSSDKKKKEYCEQHYIELIEIPYTDYDKLDWNYLKEKCNL